MKNLLFTIGTCLIFLSTLAQKPNAAIQVAENMKKQELAWNAFDIEGFMRYYWNNDSLKFIGSKGITYGWKNTLENYKKGYPNQETMGQLTFTNYSIEPLGKDAVYVIGKWQIKKKEKNVGGHYTLLWKKIKGEWVIVCDHTS
jgi:ketosteroid isomerase-like protein